MRGEHLDERRGQFDRQRQAIEARADFGDGGSVGIGHGEVRLDGLRPLDKETHGLVLTQRLNRGQMGWIGKWQRCERIFPLTIGMERSPTCRQHFETGHLGKQLGDELGGINDALDVVQDDEQVLSAHDARQTIHEITAFSPHAEDTRDGGGDEARDQ